MHFTEINKLSAIFNALQLFLGFNVTALFLRLDCHGGLHGLCRAQITDLFPYLLVILGNSYHVFKIIISSVTSDFTKSVVYHILREIWEVLALVAFILFRPTCVA